MWVLNEIALQQPGYLDISLWQSKVAREKSPERNGGLSLKNIVDKWGNLHSYVSLLEDTLKQLKHQANNPPQAPENLLHFLKTEPIKYNSWNMLRHHKTSVKLIAAAMQQSLSIQMVDFSARNYPENSFCFLASSPICAWLQSPSFWALQRGQPNKLCLFSSFIPLTYSF